MTLLTAALLLGAAALIPTGDALALERGGYSMEILIGGTPVCEYPARGKSYIEALKRREYSVRLRNHPDHDGQGREEVGPRPLRDDHPRRLAGLLGNRPEVLLHDRG